MPTILYMNASGEISGAERSLLAMLDALDRARWTAIVATPEGPLAASLRARGIPHLPVALRPPQRPRSLRQGLALMVELSRGRRQVLQVIRQAKPDLLHVNSTAAMVYCPTVPQPIIWQVRDITPLGTLGARLYRRAARLVVISTAVREEMMRYAHDRGAKMRLLPPAVDTAAFHPAADRAAARAALGLPGDTPLIGLLAQFVPWKRHHLFLDALERLPESRWHAVLAGADFHAAPDYLASLHQRLARPPFAGRVSWLPWQPDAAALLAVLDICALTSHREPFGRVLIEAMACGVPVVAVDEGGARDIIRPEETGLLTPADPDALAATFRRLLDSAVLRQQLGNAGRQAVTATFSLAEQRRVLDALYSEAGALPSHRT